MVQWEGTTNVGGDHGGQLAKGSLKSDTRPANWQQALFYISTTGTSRNVRSSEQASSSSAFLLSWMRMRSWCCKWSQFSCTWLRTAACSLSMFSTVFLWNSFRASMRWANFCITPAFSFSEQSWMRRREAGEMRSWPQQQKQQQFPSLTLNYLTFLSEWVDSTSLLLRTRNK